MPLKRNFACAAILSTPNSTRRVGGGGDAETEATLTGEAAGRGEEEKEAAGEAASIGACFASSAGIFASAFARCMNCMSDVCRSLGWRLMRTGWVLYERREGSTSRCTSTATLTTSRPPCFNT